MQTLTLWLVVFLGFLSVSISYATHHPDSIISFLAGQYWLLGLFSFITLVSGTAGRYLKKRQK